MLEAELVASRAAVAHRLDGVWSLYSCRRPESGYVEAVLIAEHARTTQFLLAQRSSEPDDFLPRIRDFVDRYSRERLSLWAQARRLVSRSMEANQGAGQASRYIEALSRNIDAAFFRNGRDVSGHSVQAEGSADSHVHVGGAVPWGVQWNALINGDYPLWLYSRADFRLVTSEDFLKLMGEAVKLREKLAERYGPKERASDPAFEDLLYRRLNGLGEKALEQDCDVRDYVLIRSLARREMLIGYVGSLTEFTGEAWKRFWGKKPERQGRGGRPWAAVLKRLEPVETDKLKAACIALQGVTADLRANPEWPPNRFAVQLIRAREVLTKNGRKLIIHGRLPKAKCEMFTNEGLEDNPELQEWRTQLKTLVSAEEKAEQEVVAGIDLAGAERETPIAWFKAAICEIEKTRRKRPALGVTVHAGEDFYDPWQGLARVMAAIDVLVGDFRVGHGSVLGVNPYSLRWKWFTCPLWARREGLEQATELARAHAPSHREVLERRLRKLPQGEKKLDLEVRVEVHPDDAEVRAFQELQLAVATKLKNQKIVVESNPTSNLRVLCAPDYSWVPFWGLVGLRLRVALGTDDPGMLATSIEEEYSRLRCCLEGRLELERAKLVWPTISRDLVDEPEVLWLQIEHSVREETKTSAEFAPAR